MTRPLIYIAGPFRAPTPWLVEQNIRVAEAAGLEVAKLGAVPVIPHTLYRFFDSSLPDEFWLDATLHLLRACDAILMLPRWTESTGACAEREYAIRTGISVLGDPISAPEWIADWFGRMA